MKVLIIANWKMNPQSLAEAKQLLNSVQKETKDVKDVEVVICPPFIYIPKIQDTKYKIQLGAQDCFWEEKGAFTGEVSSLMLKNFGCQYVIIGHSERRKYLNETDEMINKKLKVALSAKLNPILCIGETLKEKKQGKTKKVLQRQLQRAFYQIRNTKYQIPATIIAYEPVWAIGTGKACLPKEAEKSAIFIRKILSRILGQKIAKKIRILYGGSVNNQNAASYIFKASFQGLLVGGASLDPKEFVKIIKAVSLG